MCKEQKKCVVEYRPAAPGVCLSEMAKYYLSSMVPCGRLTRDKDIRNALAKLFGVSWVSFERDYVQMMQVLWDDTAIQSWNRHRIVSDGGNVYPLMEDQLRAEGFELLPSKRSKGEYRVVDYKKYLYDFEKECSLVLEDFIKYKLDRDIL